jgi:hypothetical protein
MAYTRAADDFKAICARMNDLRREREMATPDELDPRGHPALDRGGLGDQAWREQPADQFGASAKALLLCVFQFAGGLAGGAV